MIRARALLVAGTSALLACGITAVGTGPVVDQQTTEADDGAKGTPPKDDAVDGANGASDADSDASSDASSDVGLDVQIDTGPVDPYTTRIKTGLVAFYDFEENTGATALDAIAPAYDLTIQDTNRRTWHPHYLELTGYTALSNAATFTKLVTRAAVTHEFTVELWVDVGQLQSDNPCRLVSFILDATTRNIDMGIDDTSIWASTTSGSQMSSSPFPSGLFHLVVTKSANGQLTLYVNGAFRQSSGGSSDPANWTAYKLFVMNSFNFDRGIRGDLHLLAFYDVALSAANVATNYAAGADPK